VLRPAAAVRSGVGMQIHGPHLLLRYPAPADAPALFELGSDSEVTRFFSWGPYQEVDEAASYIDSLEPLRERGEKLEFLIVDGETGQPLGITGLSEFSVRDRRAVIGTWLGRAYWGTGVNAESKALITHLAFEILGLNRLSAYADVENPRSQHALEKLGFEREGLLRSWHRHGERVRDVFLYSLLKEEWAQSALAKVPVVATGELPLLSPAAAPS
jgi:ribosomal-protein-alanine N-acetyltransferase